MAVDKGSLRYRIELEASNALKGLRDFRAGLVSARQSWRAFKAELRSVDRDARSAALGLERLADASKRMADQSSRQGRLSRQQSDQSRRRTKQTQEEGKAVERLGEATERRFAFERRRIRELKRGIGAAQISAQSNEIKRLETSLGLLRQLHAAELRLIRARRLTDAGGRDLRTAATFGQEKELALLQARNKLERALSVDSDTQLQNARAELAVAQSLLKVEQQRLAAEKLRTQGALPSGRTVDQAAQQALDRERDSLNVKTRQNQLEAQQTEHERAQTREKQAQVALERQLRAQEIRRLRQRILTQRGLLTSGKTLEQTAADANAREREGLLVKKEQTRQEQAQSQEARAQLRALENELAVARTLLRVERQRAQAEALRAQGRTTRGLTVQEAAREAFQRDLERLRVEQLRRQLQKASPEFQTLRNELRGVGRETVTAEGRLRTFGNMLDRVGGKGNRISFTFRRLIGILAAFAAARAVVRVFREAVTEQVRFSAQLEQSQLGVASLITAVSTVRTALGDAADAGDRLVLAEGLARRQIALLRRDALETVATFRELADAFQTAVAPGVQAGLNLDQIREFTVRISQAAAAIGLPANQLAEEIRSILQGTIQLRTTRIAAALGITNEDIRRAKELGILVEFLNERFEAFATAGTRALSLFNAVVARLRDAFSEMLRAGGVEFFEELKSLMSETLDLLLKTTKEGIEVNPKALDVVRGIFSGLQRAVLEARRLRDSLDFGDAISLGEGLGSTIGAIAEAIGAIIEGFLKGTRDLIRLLSPLSKKILDLFPKDSGRDFVIQITRALTALGGLTLLLSTATSLAGFLVLPFVRLLGTVLKVGIALKFAVGSLVKIPAILTRIVALSSLIVSPWGLVAAAVAASLFFLGKFALEASSIELKFETIIRLIRVGLVGAFQYAAAFIEFSWTLLTNSITALLDSVVTGFKVGLRGAVEGAARLANLLPFTPGFLDETIKKLKAAREEDDADFNKRLKERATKVAAAFAELRKSLLQIQFGIGAGFTRAVGADDTARTFKELFEELKKEVLAGFPGLGDALEDSLGNSEEAARGLVQRFRELPGIVGRGTKQVEGLEDALKSILHEFQRAQESLQVTIRAEGAADFSRDLIAQEIEREFRIRQETLSITQEIEALELNRAGVQARLRDLTEKTGKESLAIATSINQAVEAGQHRIRTEQTIQEAEKRRAVLIAQENALRGQGRDDAAEAVALDVKAQEERIAGLKDALGFTERFLEFTSSALVRAGGEGLLDIVEQRVQAAGEDKSIAEDIAELENTRVDLEGKINDLIRTRIEDLARRQIEQSRDRIRQAQSELQAQRALSGFGAVREGSVRRPAAEVESDLQLENDRLALLAERANRLAQIHDQNIAALKERRAGEQEILLVQKAQNAEQLELQVEVAKQTLKTQDAIRRLLAEQRKLSDPVGFGIEQGLQDFVDRTEDQFSAWRRIATNAVEGFAATAAGLLTDALDPTKDTSALEAFGQLFLNTFQQIIENLIQLFISKILVGILPVETAGKGLTLAATSLGVAGGIVQKAANTLLLAATLLGGTGSAAGGVAKRHGGQIPLAGVPSPAHRAARGAFHGRRISAAPPARRPGWVHPKDTVPLWGQPGEWMIRAASVRKYGNSFMQAVNEGRISTTAARAMAASSRRSPSRAPSVPSFASGGRLSESLRTSASGSSPGVTILPVLTANEQTLRRLQAAGPKAQYKWMRENLNEQQLLLERR